MEWKLGFYTQSFRLDSITLDTWNIGRLLNSLQALMFSIVCRTVLMNWLWECGDTTI